MRVTIYVSTFNVFFYKVKPFSKYLRKWIKQQFTKKKLKNEKY